MLIPHFCPFQNLLKTKQGRREYFNQENVLIQGARREDAVYEFLLYRLKILLKLLDGIEMETQSFTTRGEDGKKIHHKSTFPTQRGIDLAQLAMECLSLLSQEQDYRERMSQSSVGAVLRAIVACRLIPYESLILHKKKKL